MPNNSDKTVKKSDVINAVLNYMMKKEYSSISAQKDNFKKPPLIESQKNRTKFRPDLTANLSGNLHLFEIETDPDSFKSKDTLQKWEALSHYAVDKGGRLNLVVLQEHEPEVAEVVQDNSIDADILQVTFK